MALAMAGKFLESRRRQCEGRPSQTESKKPKERRKKLAVQEGKMRKQEVEAEDGSTLVGSRRKQEQEVEVSVYSVWEA